MKICEIKKIFKGNNEQFNQVLKNLENAFNKLVKKSESIEDD